MEEKLITFEDWLRTPMVMHFGLGIIPYKKRNATESVLVKIILGIIFYVGTVNVFVTILAELAFFLNTFKSYSSLMEATAIFPCLLYTCMSQIKMYIVWSHRKVLTRLVHKLEDIFPATLHAQEEYSVKSLKRTMNIVVWPFILTTGWTVWAFNLTPIFQSTIEYVFMDKDFEWRYPYLLWYPFEITTRGMFVFIYCHHVLAGYTAVTEVIASDTLLCFLVAMICMHFKYVAKSFTELQPTGTDEDIKKLKKLTRYHSVLLDLTEDLNKVYSFSILNKFIALSLVICLVGFQTSVGANMVDLFKYGLFTSCSVTQVYAICFYGDRLIDSSQSVGDGAYNHSWMYASKSYQKQVLQVIHRSLLPAYLKATTFPPISLATFQKVMGVSYRFFAVLRTFYSR